MRRSTSAVLTALAWLPMTVHGCSESQPTDAPAEDVGQLRRALSAGELESALASNAADAFAAPDPAKWTAPYNKYAPGWWEAFYPGNENA